MQRFNEMCFRLRWITAVVTTPGVQQTGQRPVYTKEFDREDLKAGLQKAERALATLNGGAN